MKEFKVKINNQWFDAPDVMTNASEQKIKITSKPTVKYNKWYHKLIRWITFGYCFRKEYSYTVKLLDDERTTG